jgi:hypothetical protein
MPSIRSAKNVWLIFAAVAIGSGSGWLWRARSQHRDPAIHKAQGRAGFGGTYIGLPAGEQDLDSTPTVVRSRPFDCPPDLRGVSEDAAMSAMVWVKHDGSVTDVLVSGGEDIRFRAAVQRAISGWKFSIPTRSGKAVDAQLSVRLRASGNGITGIEVTFQEG